MSSLITCTQKVVLPMYFWGQVIFRQASCYALHEIESERQLFPRALSIQHIIVLLIILPLLLLLTSFVFLHLILPRTLAYDPREILHCGCLHSSSELQQWATLPFVQEADSHMPRADGPIAPKPAKGWIGPGRQNHRGFWVFSWWPK